MNNKYPLITAFLTDLLPDKLEDELAAQRDNPIAAVPENCLRALAAANLRVKIENEWFAINATLTANSGHLLDCSVECDLYDEVM